MMRHFICSLLCWMLVAVFQWFSFDREEAFDTVAIVFS